MRFGFCKIDITPRLGVPLCGFGPFLNRVSVGIRDRLGARAMAVEHDGERIVVVSCDLVGICQEDTDLARRLVEEAKGLPPKAMLVSCSHTHSGPETSPRRIGWGGYDPPYMQLLPRRIAAAAISAIEKLEEASLSYAEAPCEGIGLNREHDKDAPPLEDVLREGWRPAKPELTDTTCHVAKVESDGRLLGFFSYFGCHPVCCCASTRHIHGDFAGVATNMLERENPGSVGLFLQGAEGDVNSCVVHKPEQEALLALDVIAARYANAVRGGMARTRLIEGDPLRSAIKRVSLSQRRWSEDELRARLAEEEKTMHAPGATDEDTVFRMATVRAIALRRILQAVERGDPLDQPVELQGLRIGPLMLLASPFETFQGIKNKVRDEAKSEIPLVLGVSNDSRGYAPDRVAAERGGYAADVVPMINGHFPFDRLYEQLPSELLVLEAELL